MKATIYSKCPNCGEAVTLTPLTDPEGLKTECTNCDWITVEYEKPIIGKYTREYHDYKDVLKDAGYEVLTNGKFSGIPEACVNCPNHPSNGGSGICHCTLGIPQVTC